VTFNITLMFYNTHIMQIKSDYQILIQ